MVQTKFQTSVTLTEFLRMANLEESPAWELFEQRVSQKPIPTLHHSILQKRLVGTIDNTGGEYEAFPELRCVLNNHSVVPDVAVLRRDRQPIGNQPVSGPPDWIIEILSPDQSTTKLIAKIQSCLQEGARLGWLVDPEERLVMFFWPDRPLMLFQNEGELPVLEDMVLNLTVTQIFDWLPSDSHQ